MARFSESWRDQHRAASAVARRTPAETVAAIREAIDRAIAAGTSCRQFRAQLDLEGTARC